MTLMDFYQPQDLIQQGQGNSGELHSEYRVTGKKPPHKILSTSCFKPGLKVSCDQHSQLSTFIPGQWQEPCKLSKWMGKKELNGEHHKLDFVWLSILEISLC